MCHASSRGDVADYFYKVTESVTSNAVPPELMDKRYRIPYGPLRALIFHNKKGSSTAEQQRIKSGDFGL
jgi:hypothetical protein